jgi:hypothetical protein
MRLLRTEADEGFRLVEYVSEIAAPPYAILSHRWGADDEEYTYKDLLEGTGKHKIGYQKVRACGVQAIKDNLDYFWVDTCCIDKSSSAELSEAINSMWLWYCNSEVCYAFLNDVPAEIGHQDRNQVLGRSKWFTRGWTLQELLAPRRVNFYNATWKLIGTKHNMAGIISSITHIGQVYLSDRPDPLETASIAERMSWASRRETKRVEDVTYCLLGIFGVSMPLLYGEGDRAFQRLQEEIMKQSDDQSIFAWEVLPTEYDGSMLARSPNAFSACGNIVRALNSSSTTPYTMTNRGLQIELPLMHRGDGFVARLNCRYKHDFFSDLGVPIRRARKGFQFVRDDDDVSSIALTRWRDSSLHTIYMKTAAKYFGARNDPQQDSVIIRNLPPGYVISQVFPPHNWAPGAFAINAISYPEREEFSPEKVLVKLASETGQEIIFMFPMGGRASLSRRVLEARILPVSLEESTDMAHLYYQWRDKRLSTLSRVRSCAHGISYLRATDTVVRGRRFMVVDIVLNEDRHRAIREAFEQVTSTFLYTGLCVNTFAMDLGNRRDLSLYYSLFFVLSLFAWMLAHSMYVAVVISVSSCIMLRKYTRETITEPFGTSDVRRTSAHPTWLDRHKLLFFLIGLLLLAFVSAVLWRTYLGLLESITLTDVLLTAFAAMVLNEVIGRR